jgi:hypothetical protein
MARSVNDYLNHMLHAMGQSPDSRHVQIDTFNDAARYVFEYLPWAFRKVGPKYLAFPAAVALSSAAYSVVSGVHTITDSGAFTNYRFLAGDELDLTAGTGITVGSYRILGRTSADVITLIDDPGDAAASGVEGTIRQSAVSAPADFGQLLSVGIDNSEGVSGDFTRIRLVTPEDIVRMREDFFEPDGGYLYLAVQNTASVSAITASTPIWPCYPLPDSGSEPRIVVTYRRNWTDMSAGTDIPPFPAQFTRALLLACRSFAVNLENQSQAAEEPQLQDELGRLAREQGGVQEDFGPIRGGVSAMVNRRERVILGDVAY